MGNIENLKPRTTLTSEEAKRMGSAGGKASVQARKEKKLLKELLVERTQSKDLEEMIDNAIRRAMRTDKGFEIYRDTIGEKPTDKIEADITANIEIDIDE